MNCELSRDIIPEIKTRVRNMGVDIGMESDGTIFCWGGEVVTMRMRRAEQERHETRFKAIYMEVYVG